MARRPYLTPACMTPSMAVCSLSARREGAITCADVGPCGSRFAPRWGDAAHYDSYAQVAERQTRCLQVAVSLRAWGFKSPLAHSWDVPECRGHLFPKVPGQRPSGREFSRPGPLDREKVAPTRSCLRVQENRGLRARQSPCRGVLGQGLSTPVP